jgi:hypothetical protein
MKESLEGFFVTLQEDLDAYEEITGKSSPAIQRLRQRSRKRAKLGDSKVLREKAIQDFLTCNDSIRETRCNLSVDVISNARHFIFRCLANYTSAIRSHNVQVTFDPLILNDLWGFGPGQAFDSEAVHAAEKIDAIWGVTSQALPYLRRIRNFHPYLYKDVKGGGWYEFVEGSSLATVPKNQETERVIAKEPIGNMVCQLAGGRYLQGALAMVGLDITSQQPRNRALAKRYSINNRGTTLDLKDASNRGLIDTARVLLPSEWTSFLEAVRSPRIRLPNGSWIDLNMMSTMGNGFTFPLMTLIITSICYGVACRSPKQRSLFLDWKNWAVYGDDIICPKQWTDDVCQELENAGYLVNRDKSFSDGPFRESCGGDFYNGMDITPFYVKELSNDAEVYVAINQVLEWAGRHNVSLHRSYQYLVSLLRDPVLLVPEWSEPDSGVKTSMVSQKYVKLMPKVKYVPYKGSSAWTLAVGGYIQQRKRRLFYTPRQFKTRYVRRTLRLPRGFLDGRDASTRPAHVSNFIDTIISMS